MTGLEYECDEAGRLAVAATPAPWRKCLAAALALDARLARVIVEAREPMLAQVRLAWWRDRLREAALARPRGDPVLDAIGAEWAGDEAALVALIDGWEELLGDSGADREVCALATGRSAVFAAFAVRAGRAGEVANAATCGRFWAAATVQRMTGSLSPAPLGPLPWLGRPLRGLALLGGLSRRAILRGDGVLLGDRLSPLAALRLALIGR